MTQRPPHLATGDSASRGWRRLPLLLLGEHHAAEAEEETAAAAALLTVQAPSFPFLPKGSSSPRLEGAAATLKSGARGPGAHQTLRRSACGGLTGLGWDGMAPAASSGALPSAHLLRRCRCPSLIRVPSHSLAFAHHSFAFSSPRPPHFPQSFLHSYSHFVASCSFPLSPFLAFSFFHPPRIAWEHSFSFPLSPLHHFPFTFSLLCPLRFPSSFWPWSPLTPIPLFLPWYPLSSYILSISSFSFSFTTLAHLFTFFLFSHSVIFLCPPFFHISPVLFNYPCTQITVEQKIRTIYLAACGGWPFPVPKNALFCQMEDVNLDNISSLAPSLAPK